MSVWRDAHGNWYRHGELVRPLLLTFYFYAAVRVFVAAAVARYLLYLIGKDIPVWYYVLVGVVFLGLCRRIRQPALQELRKECAQKWLEDEARPVASIREALAGKETVDPRSTAPLYLPDPGRRS